MCFGHSMGYNYNGKLRSAELLLREDGGVDLIRRAETPEDYFAAVVWCGPIVLIRTSLLYQRSVEMSITIGEILYF